MADIARRFENNPVLRPQDVAPSRDGLEVACLLNPGAFRFGGRVGLLMRVAERPIQQEGRISTPVLDPADPSGISIVEFDLDDPQLDYKDPRIFHHGGRSYLTTLSHLRLAWSDDGVHFTPDPQPTLIGHGELETFGIEDARVVDIDGTYYITYTQVSDNGVGVGLITTTDWRQFTRHGMILPPSNKDAPLLPEKVGTKYCVIHRPSGMAPGGNYMWTAFSEDLIHWGEHRCIAQSRPGMWDSARIGAGAAPIRTARGWLEIYHGADENSRYCLGAMLLDANDPSKLIARTTEPIMEPIAGYETTGFFGHVVFTNGHVQDGDTLTVYYGAADDIVCGATFSIDEILGLLAQKT